eukprot:2456754-Prymnesium_polylepis.1
MVYTQCIAKLLACSRVLSAIRSAVGASLAHPGRRSAILSVRSVMRVVRGFKDYTRPNEP